MNTHVIGWIQNYLKQQFLSLIIKIFCTQMCVPLLNDSSMNSQKDFCGWGSTTDPAGGAHNAPPDPLADSWGSAPDPKG